MPTHIKRLLLLMAVFACVALFAKAFFTRDSFYRFGHYRGDSVAQIASQVPAFQTPKACVECHGIRHAEWSGQAHKTVICEVCHGAAVGHPQAGKVTIPAETVRLCTQCHEAMPGRPITSIRQIPIATHYPGASCISCHNPHAPRLPAANAAHALPAPGLLRAGAAAAAACAACHGPEGISPNPELPNIAGQSEAYIVRSLAGLRVGSRKSEVMGPMAQMLSDDDIRAVAAHFSARSCAAPAVRASGAEFEAGRKLSGACAACHGDRGQGGANTSIPRLAGQRVAYLGAALQAFQSGQRANPAMAAATKDLSATDREGLATYFAAQSCRAAQPLKGNAQ
jgi:cytochrome c553